MDLIIISSKETYRYDCDDSEQHDSIPLFCRCTCFSQAGSLGFEIEQFHKLFVVSQLCTEYPFELTDLYVSFASVSTIPTVLEIDFKWSLTFTKLDIAPMTTMRSGCSS